MTTTKNVDSKSLRMGIENASYHNHHSTFNFLSDQRRSTGDCKSNNGYEFGCF